VTAVDVRHHRSPRRPAVNGEQDVPVVPEEADANVELQLQGGLGGFDLGGRAGLAVEGRLGLARTRGRARYVGRGSGWGSGWGRGSGSG
jgi:hypothetical protein